MPFLRDGNARADVITHPLPALSLGYGSEDVKAALEPVIKTMGDLDRLMLGMVGGKNTICGCLRASDREIAVELNHGVSRINQVRSVHLYFVVILCVREGSSEAEGQKCNPEKATFHEEDYQLHDEFSVAGK